MAQGNAMKERQKAPSKPKKLEVTATTTHRPRVDTDVEAKIIEHAVKHPGHGQDRVARELRAQRQFVSPSGVRYVWQRHNLETMVKRVQYIERLLGNGDDTWTVEQHSARDRVRAKRRTRSIAASVVGRDAGDVSRSAYILVVAARLLREQGYESTSLRNIADRAQIPVGSLYYHFQSKEELFAAVYEEGVTRLAAALNTAIKPLRDPWKRLERACITHLEHLCGGDDFAAVSIPTNLPSIQGAVRDRLIEMNNRYEEIFRQLIADLHPAKFVSPGILRLQILGALNWTGIWFRPNKASPADIARNLVKALRLGLKGAAIKSARATPATSG